MPRNAKRKTQTGYPAQAVKSVPGQRYGEGPAQQALQRALPAPQVVGENLKGARAASAAAGQAAGVGWGAARELKSKFDDGDIPNGAVQASEQDLMAIAARMQGRAGLLRQPTMRPAEPITAGLASGPGPGPEALQAPRGSPTADVLNRLADLTGDSYLRDLAQRARL
jgi:hypothetical protein